jgi:hypothetical protein
MRLLALPLLMLRVFTTDYHHHAVTPDYLAVFTAPLDRCTNFHDCPPQGLREISFGQDEVATQQAALHYWFQPDLVVEKRCSFEGSEE